MNMYVIPNKLVFALALSFYAFALVYGLSVEDIGQRTALGAGIMALGLILFVTFSVPPGSMKLIAVAFLWFGFEGGCIFTVISMLTAGLYGKAMQIVDSDHRRVPYLPFAALTAGFMLCVWIVKAGSLPA